MTVRTKVHDEEQSGQPSALNDDLLQVLEKNCE
jgi:hypothetical protein